MDSASSLPLAEMFLVYQFSLVATASGRVEQKVVKVGELPTAEDALDCARELALALAAVHADAVVSSGADTETETPAICLRPSEWGYDVLREQQLVARFWVRSRPV